MDYLMKFISFKLIMRNIFLNVILIHLIILTRQYNSRDLVVFHKNIVDDLKDIAYDLKKNFKNRCNEKCIPAWNSCSSELEDLKCTKKEIESDCEMIFINEKYLTIQIQNKYNGNDEITNKKIKNKNYGLSHFKEIICPQTKKEINEKFEKLNTNYPEVDQFYIGSYLGSISRSPGRQKCPGSNINDFYNPTERAWFCYAATGLKKLIILVDFSKNFIQKNQIDRTDNILKIIQLIFDSLSFQDYVSVILFDDKIINKNYSNLNNFEKKLGQSIKDDLIDEAKKERNSTNSKDYSRSIRAALDLIKNEPQKDGINAVFLITDGNAKDDEIKQLDDLLDSYNFSIFENWKPAFFLIGLGPFDSTQNSRKFLENLSCKVNGIAFIDYLDSILEKIKNYCLILSNKIIIEPQIVGPYSSYSQNKVVYSYSVGIFSEIENEDFLVYVLGVDFQLKNFGKNITDTEINVKSIINRQVKGAMSFALDICQLETIRQSNYGSNYSCKNNNYFTRNIYNYTISNNCSYYFMKHQECPNDFYIEDNQEIFYSKLKKDTNQSIEILENIDKNKLCCKDSIDSSNFYDSNDKIIPYIILSVVIFLLLILLLIFCLCYKKKPNFLLNKKTKYKRLNIVIRKTNKNIENINEILNQMNENSDEITIIRDTQLTNREDRIHNINNFVVRQEQREDIYILENIYERKNKRREAKNKIVLMFVSIINSKFIYEKIKEKIQINKSISVLEIFYFWEKINYKNLINRLIPLEIAEIISDDIWKNMSHLRDGQNQISENIRLEDSDNYEWKYKFLSLKSNYQKCFELFLLLNLHQEGIISIKNDIKLENNNNFFHFTIENFFHNNIDLKFNLKKSDNHESYYSEVMKSIISNEIEISSETNEIFLNILQEYNKCREGKYETFKTIKEKMKDSIETIYKSIYSLEK